MTTKNDEFHKCKSGALKHLDNKLMVDLITPEMLESLAIILTYGATKYEPRNWEKGIPMMSSYAAALRHLIRWLDGEDLDKESGLSHIDHALTNLAMLATQISREREDLDDRPKKTG